MNLLGEIWAQQEPSVQAQEHTAEKHVEATNASHKEQPAPAQTVSAGHAANESTSQKQNKAKQQAPKTNATQKTQKPASAVPLIFRADATNTPAPNTVPADSAAADSAAPINPAKVHIAMTRPASEKPRSQAVHSDSPAMSWIILVLITLFVLIALRFRNNLRFTGSMFKELLEAPRRRPIFDDTMRETTFTALLNLLCIASGGIVLWQSVGRWALPSILSGPHMLYYVGVCLMCMALLYGGQWIAYSCIGNIFFTRELTKAWLRSFSASQGLLSLVLLPLALISLFYAGATAWLLIPAIFAWILARLLFISKGFRIFLPHNANILAFLYYLCAVEIVPVVLTCQAATALCSA